MKKMQQVRSYIILLGAIGILLASAGIAKATLSDPGSQEDPLVTLSYVEKRIEQIKYYIDQKVQEVINISNSNTSVIEELKGKIENLGETNSQLINEVEKIKESGPVLQTGLEVVELRNGQKLIGKAGTEIILRAGNAKAIASELGGLSDVTGGRDIQMNENIPANHLLIIPRDDGRGVYIEEYAIFMIRGEYEIK